MNEIKTTEYDGIKLSEYKGKYSIEALKPKDDKFYGIWAKYHKNKDEYNEKDYPVKVVLGDRETAVNALKKLLLELQQDASEGHDRDVPPMDNNQVPF